MTRVGARRIAVVLGVCAVMVRGGSASAQDAGAAASDAGGTEAIAWPRRVPGLETVVQDPRDGRDWTLRTRVTDTSVTVFASAREGQLALVFERRRAGPAGCSAALAGELRAQRAVYSVRAEPAVALRGAGFDPNGAFQLRAGGYELEYGCVESSGLSWVVTAMANARAGLALGDGAAMAGRMADAIRARGARADGSVRLEQSGLDLGVLDEPGPWLFTGEAAGFPLTGDAVSHRAGERGGVTLSIALRSGRCADAWNTLRPWLTTEGERVERPAYVPAPFGPRIRRVSSGERVREVYCAQPTPERALVVSAVFAANDPDAATRAGAMLERTLRAATPARLTSGGPRATAR
jgi:hypothetical protein